MLAIKVGSNRLVLDNVTHIDERESNFLQKTIGGPKDGEITENYYAKQEETFKGLVVTIYFVSSGETSDYVRLYTVDAQKFLAEFDHMLQTITA